MIWYPLPQQKIHFFAYLHDLEQVTKKKCENDPILSSLIASKTASVFVDSSNIEEDDLSKDYPILT